MKKKNPNPKHQTPPPASDKQTSDAGRQDLGRTDLEHRTNRRRTLFPLISKTKTLLPHFLSKKRINHSLRVAKTAKNLAIHWQQNPEKAYLAGLLHDIGKELKFDDLKKYKKHPKQLEKSIYKDYPQIWHAFVGPLIIKNEFKITDKEILNAVKWHTTGKAKMSTLEEILYIADYIEPERDFSSIEFIQKLAYSDLQKAVLATTINTLLYLLEHNIKIHNELIKCHNDYIQKCDVKDVQKLIQKLIKINL